MKGEPFMAYQEVESLRTARLRWPLLCATAFLSACGHVPMQEFELFRPLPVANRIMQQPKVSWEIREDVASYCAQAKGMGQQQAFMTPPLACAIWHISKNECTVVTGRDVSHVALGHELRHCFEGHFH